MRNYFLRLCGMLLLGTTVLLAQSAPKSAQKPAPADKKTETKDKEAKSTKKAPVPRFDSANIDRSLDPCKDFYAFACSKWERNNPIPADYPSWVSFAEVYEYNLGVLHAILDKYGANDPKRTPVQQKIGDYYASCMDEAAANKAGVKPLQPELDRIAGLKDKAQMIDLIAHEMLIGPNPIFGFNSGADFHNSDMTIANIDQSGMTLPDRDYYLKEDPDMVAIRKGYVEHMIKMFTMLGQTTEQAAKSADTVLTIETELAKASMDRTLRRDPKNIDHKMALADVELTAPSFHLRSYFAAAGAPAFKELNVANPDYFKEVNGVIDSTPLDSWKTYLTWQMLNNAASWLSDDFVQQDFKFSQQFTGQKELPARWKRCISATDSALGEALGQPYVDETFGKDGKERMLKMVDALEYSLHKDISDLPWMTEATKKEALVKLAAIRNKIGYPDQWRDYSKLSVTRDNFLANLQHATEFESNRQIQKIGQPVDRNEWGMTPPTVNAYYSGDKNEIVFPAGILQPPFFDKTMDDPINFGAVGLVIGHELTHGFDDEGRKFDPKGNLRDWWTEEDGKEFEKRAACVADEYSSFVAADDIHLNGKLTLGENTADNGGARIALMALHDMMTATKQDPNKKLDGFTPDQRFFLGFARVWCENITPELLRLSARVDPHSPGRWRVNGTVQNMPEFQKAFGCKVGQPMVAANACRVW